MVYQNINSPPPYVVTETKYRTDAEKYIDESGLAKDKMLLSKTKGSTANGISFPPATQLSDVWIEPRVKVEVTKRGQADEVLDSDYERWLMLVDETGKVVNITKLDENAKPIGSIPL